MIQDENALNHFRGLTQQEVMERRAAGQGNNIALPTSRSYRRILQENLFTFINVVFFAISAVMAVLQRYGDAVLVVVVIVSGIVMNIAQEIWAKRKLDEIALLNRPIATVIRDGIEQPIEPGEIVLGDIMVVRAGDQILVDGAVVGDGRIDVDESLLTGESDMIPKLAGDSVYSGTFCVSGSGYFEAQKVGTETVAYKLVTGARVFRQVYTPLQQEINLVIRVFLLLACFLWILVGISFLSRSLPLADIVQRAAVIAGLVPAGLVVAITLAYGTGAVRMLGENVLIQQANAVESLSNVDVLCLDKTGTLTTNQLNLQAIYPVDMTEAALQQALGDFAANTSAHNRTSEAIAATYTGTPRTVKAEVPFSSARQWSALSFSDDSNAGVYVLGAPEVLSRSLPLTEAMANTIQTGVQQGLRMLLFAYGDDATAIGDINKPALPTTLKPLGILQFSDQLRPQVRQTLDGFARAGISVKIISGDNPQTVAALAKQAGLGPEVRLVSGPELALMDGTQLMQAATTCNVFGRITPEQKARLVQVLRQHGCYVAMIGDGVNDVLSLKQANLGIAMESGSKATRGVADIVLLKDSFAALPHTFLEGQRIRNGIRDALALFIVRVFSITLLIFSTAMVTDSFPLVNKHSALVSLFGVGLPTTVLPIWAKPGGYSRQRRSMIHSLLHFTIPAALTLSLVALLVYLLYLVSAILDLAPGSEFTQLDYTQPRTALVTILVLCQLLLIPFLKPPTTAWVGGEPLSGDWRYATMALVLLLVYFLILAVPVARNFFELSTLSPPHCIFLSMVALEWCLILRVIWRGRFLDRFLGVDLS